MKRLPNIGLILAIIIGPILQFILDQYKRKQAPILVTYCVAYWLNTAPHYWLNTEM
jgi:hypothetical protein